MNVEAAQPRDGEALRNLHAATWAVTYRGRLPEAWYRERLAAHRVRDWTAVVRRQTAAGGGVLAARLGGRIAGLCQYGPTEDDDHDRARIGHVHRLYVDPGRQRTGVGRALLAPAMTRLHETGFVAVTAWVLETDAGARAFYEALGWKADGERRSEPAAAASEPITDLRYRSALG